MREIYLGITFLVTVLVAFDGYFRVDAITSAAAELKSWGILLSAFALGLAAIGLFQLHATRIAKRRAEWPYSTVLLLGMIWFGLVGTVMGTSSPTYTFAYRSLLQPTGNAVFSMLMFYIVTAAYRSFSIGKWQSLTILMAAAFIMLGSVPIGEAVWGKIPAISGWILRVPNTAGQRGIIIGASIGGIAAALRAALGLERAR
jgi:hypothetical protein